MKPLAAVRPINGLANRLRAVTSTLAVAQRFGLRFGMLFGPGPSFSNESWPELFANELTLVDPGEFAAFRQSGVPILQPKSAGPGTDLRGRRLRRALGAGFVFDHAFMDVDYLLRRRGVRFLGRVRALRRRLCRRLRPAAPLAEAVNAFSAEHFDGPVVGVHIRRGDALEGPHREQYAASTDAAFEAALQTALDRTSRTRFFLATDCEATQARFRERFGERLLTYEKRFVPSVFDTVKEGQRDAVVELFLLSRTHRILGTRWSTFGEMAARIGGIPFRAAMEGPAPRRIPHRP